MFGMRKGEELKTPRHASAAASRDDRLPHSQQTQTPQDRAGGVMSHASQQDRAPSKEGMIRALWALSVAIAPTYVLK